MPYKNENTVFPFYYMYIIYILWILWYCFIFNVYKKIHFLSRFIYSSTCRILPFGLQYLIVSPCTRLQQPMLYSRLQCFLFKMYFIHIQIVHKFFSSNNHLIMQISNVPSIPLAISIYWQNFLWSARGVRMRPCEELLFFYLDKHG